MSGAVRTVEIFQKIPGPQSFMPGEVIFTEKEKGELMYGILEGEVEMVVANKVVETLNTGDVFGEGALVQPDQSRASTAIAKTRVVLAVMDKERFLFAIQNTPMFALEVMRSYSDRLRELKHQM